MRPSQKIHYVPQERQLSFELEPMVLAHLGQGDAGADIRASKHKKLSEIPASVKNAVLAIEDERFYSHSGVDLTGIGRAMFQNIKARRLVQGGSTITQQLAKNMFLTPQRNIKRKVLELFTALSLEQRLTKDQILELYLNEVYLGQEGPVAIHGMAEATRTYFGKDLENISVDEAALLAGIIKAPSAYAPRRHLKRALDRRELVLEKMRELNFISEVEMRTAKSSKPKIREASDYARFAPYYLSALDAELGEQFDREAASKFNVYTALNPRMQRCAEKAVSTALGKLEASNAKVKQPANKRLQAALVSLEPFSGKVRAWVGGRSFSESQFDRVSLASRQIGSTIKPFLYLTALDRSLNSYKVATAMSILSDEPVHVEIVKQATWEPENYDRHFRGDVTLRYALENSLNMPAVYIAEKVGIPAVANTLRRFRLAKTIPEVPALALGAADTTLLNLTSAYGVLANGGEYVSPRLFISALDEAGNLLASPQLIQDKVADENAVFVLTDILQGVVERGTGRTVRRMGYKGVVAGKTGTSNEARDAWFVGFSPDLVTGVWVGYDDNSPTGLTGGSAAAPIWTEYLQCLEPEYHALPFIRPGDVIMETIDASSHELAGHDCPSNLVVSELFVRGTEPRRYCRRHGAYPEDLPPSAGLEDSPPGKGQRKKGFWDILFGD